MGNITLQFTAIDLDGRTVYKPSCKMSQLLGVSKNVDFFDQQQLDQFQAAGYIVVLEEDASYHYLKMRN